MKAYISQFFCLCFIPNQVIFKVIKSFSLSSSILKSLSLPNQVILKVITEKETKEVYVFYGKEYIYLQTFVTSFILQIVRSIYVSFIIYQITRTFSGFNV